MAETFRLERDSLGDVKVPATALYGAQTQRAADNFRVSGLRPWRAFIWAMAVVKWAAAEVNAELGFLDPARSRAIVEAAQEVAEGRWDDQFVVDPFQAGAGTSHNMNTNEVIANRATQALGGALGTYLVHPNDHVNMSQSTNDTIPTAIRLGCLWRMDELLAAVTDLAGSLAAKAAEFDPIVKSGRTHLQDAVPLRLGQEFAGYARAVDRDADRLREGARSLVRLGIGGTAVGTGLNAPEGYAERMVRRLSELTGLELSLSDHLIESTQSMADFAHFSGNLRTLATTLTRIANDFRLLASGPTSGLDEIRLPAVQPGSSIMPGKVNPVMAEMLNMAMFHVMGLDSTVALAVQAGQLELNVMTPIIAHHLFQMMHVTLGAVRAFDEKCVRGLTANRARAEAWLAKNPIIATALNPLIGYAAAADLVKDALRQDVPIREIVTARIRERKLFHKDDPRRPVTVEEVDAILGNPERLTEGGIHGITAG
jgi:fumarate hydratase class II